MHVVELSKPLKVIPTVSFLLLLIVLLILLKHAVFLLLHIPLLLLLMCAVILAVGNELLARNCELVSLKLTVRSKLCALSFELCNIIYTTRNSGRYATLFLAPAEGWWPSVAHKGPFRPPGW